MEKILIADDNPINLKMLEEMIKILGYETVLATNGKEAVDIFEPGIYNLVLLDIMMPEMDGVEAMHLIKEKEQNIVVYAVTANIFFEQIEEYQKYGFDDIITKPITLDDLNKKLKKTFIN